MKSLKIFVMLIILFSMLSCVSKKKMNTLEIALHNLVRENEEKLEDDDEDGVINYLQKAGKRFGLTGVGKYWKFQQ